MLKVASCDLVLRMIEEGVVMRDLTMENPIRAIREISHDVTGRRKVRLANGREASALDIQQEYLAQGPRLRRPPRDLARPIIEQALDLWERGLKAVESDDLGLVDREIDWVIKWKLIERYRAKHGLPLGHPRIAQLDLAYHDIHRDRGLYYLLEKRGAVARVTTDLKIFEAKSVPPQTTRARLRGEFIRKRPGAPPRLHRRLGAPQAQRPGPAHRAVQGPVPGARRAGAAADRRHVTGARPAAAGFRGPPVPRIGCDRAVLPPPIEGASVPVVPSPVRLPCCCSASPCGRRLRLRRATGASGSSSGARSTP